MTNLPNDVALLIIDWQHRAILNLIGETGKPSKETPTERRVNTARADTYAICAGALVTLYRQEGREDALDLTPRKDYDVISRSDVVLVGGDRDGAVVSMINGTRKLYLRGDDGKDLIYLRADVDARRVQFFGLKTIFQDQVIEEDWEKAKEEALADHMRSLNPE